MGWSYTRGATKQDIITHLVKGWENEAKKTTCVRHAVRGNILWAVYDTVTKETDETNRWIGCCILGKSKDYGWGYKDMEESMGPCYYSCPLSFLDMTPVPKSEFAEGWRQKVREHHARSQIKLTLGQAVKFIEGLSVHGTPIKEGTVVGLRPLLVHVAGVGNVKTPKKYVLAA